PPARRLGDGELCRQQEWVAETDVDHINCKRDLLSASRHCRKERGCIPRAVAARLCGYMVKAGEDMEAEALDVLPCCGQLVEPPSPLARLYAEAQHRNTHGRIRVKPRLSGGDYDPGRALTAYSGGANANAGAGWLMGMARR